MQTAQEKKTILRIWLEKMKPANLLDTEHNGNVLYNYFETNGYAWSFDNLNIACKNLGDIATGGKLQFNPKTVVKTVYVEVEKQKTARELEHERVKESQSHGFQGVRKITTEFDRIIPDNPKPNEAKTAFTAWRDFNNDVLLQEANSVIASHRGHTHGATARQQEELIALRDKLVRAKVSPEKILDAIRSKHNSYSDTSIRGRY